MSIQSIAFIGGIIWGVIAGYVLPESINQLELNKREKAINYYIDTFHGKSGVTND